MTSTSTHTGGKSGGNNGENIYIQKKNVKCARMEKVHTGGLEVFFGFLKGVALVDRDNKYIKGKRTGVCLLRMSLTRRKRKGWGHPAGLSGPSRSRTF